MSKEFLTPLSSTCSSTMDESTTSISLFSTTNTSIVSFDDHVMIHNIPNQKMELNKRDKCKVWWSSKELLEIRDDCQEELDTLKEMYGEENAACGLVSHTNVFAFRGLELIGRDSSKAKRQKRAKKEFVNCMKMDSDMIDIEETCENYKQVVTESENRAKYHAQVDMIAIRDYIKSEGPEGEASTSSTTKASWPTLNEQEIPSIKQQRRRSSLMKSAKSVMRSLAFSTKAAPSSSPTSSLKKHPSTTTPRRNSRKIGSQHLRPIGAAIVSPMSSSSSRRPLPRNSYNFGDGSMSSSTSLSIMNETIDEDNIQSVIDGFADSGLIHRKHGARTLKNNFVEQQRHQPISI